MEQDLLRLERERMPKIGLRVRSFDGSREEVSVAYCAALIPCTRRRLLCKVGSLSWTRFGVSFPLCGEMDVLFGWSMGGESFQKHAFGMRLGWRMVPRCIQNGSGVPMTSSWSCSTLVLLAFPKVHVADM